MAWKKHLLFWIIALFILLLALPIFTPAYRIWANVGSELEMIQNAFGAPDTQQLAHAATGVYNKLFVESGFVQTVQKGEVDEASRNMGKEMLGNTIMALSGVTNNYVRAFSAMVYVVMIRLFIILGWMPYLLPFLAAVIVDGLARRKIKMSEIGAPSAVKFSIALHFIILIIVFPMLYLIAPMAITPLFVPTWALLSALPLSVLVANTQPMEAR